MDLDDRTTDYLDDYSPPVHLPLSSDYTPQQGDHVEIYGNGRVVLENAEGHIVAIAEKIVWKRPALVCPLGPSAKEPA